MLIDGAAFCDACFKAFINSIPSPTYNSKILIFLMTLCSENIEENQNRWNPIIIDKNTDDHSMFFKKATRMNENESGRTDPSWLRTLKIPADSLAVLFWGILDFDMTLLEEIAKWFHIRFIQIGKIVGLTTKFIFTTSVNILFSNKENGA